MAHQVVLAAAALHNMLLVWARPVSLGKEMLAQMEVRMLAPAVVVVEQEPMV
jgi:hypothetical protein